MGKLFDDLQKSIDNEYASVASAGLDADITSFIDTGSYSLNALVSGSLYGGIPSNKITGIAGEQATGKTYFVLNIIRSFLESNEKAGVIFFDTEQAVTSDMMEARGIDTNRVFVVPVSTVQEFRTQAIKILDKYMERNMGDRTPLMMALDSLGMLSTTKEMEDTAAGKETKDMTRAQIIKSAFRVLTLKLGKANVPLIVTNHLYAVIGSMFPQKEQGGGGGLKYAASTIVFLSKAKEKDGKDVIGNVIHLQAIKSRMTKENKKTDTRLLYESGLEAYYGLVDLGLKHGVFQKAANKIQFPDGSKAFEKTVYKNPEKYFTEEVMEQLEQASQKEFRYGNEYEEAE